MVSFAIVPAGPLIPEGLSHLRDQADNEGIGIVSTLVTRWVDGTERYDRAGESLLAATVGDDAVAIGALSWCPHVSGALRVRRFYVAPDWRRRGLARNLAAELMSSGFRHSDTITCNARASAAAAPFWESLGFVPVEKEGITHLRRATESCAPDIH